MAREEKSAVERLKNRLYARDGIKKQAPQERSTLTPNEEVAPTSWQQHEVVAAPASTPDIVPPASFDANAPIVVSALTPMKHKRHMSFAIKFFIASVLFFIGAIGVSAMLFFGGINTTSPQNIDVQIIAPSLIDGGKQADFQIIITNRNTTSLDNTDLVINYPDGARSSSDPTKALTHERIAIGTISSGQQIKKTASAIFYGSEGTSETIAAVVEYNVSGSNAIFEKKGETNFTIGSAPISLTIEAPVKATAGDQFTMDITIRSNSTTPVNNVAIEGQYPFGFVVANTQPVAGAGGTIWRLGRLDPGASKVVHVTGSIDAVDGDERVFRFLVGSNTDQTDPHIKVPFLTVPQTLTVEKPFITGSISLEGKTGTTVSVPAGKVLNGVIHWENNLPDAVSGLELTLSFDGPAIDMSSINGSNGFYQSNSSSIIWTSEADSSLLSVPPGGKGSFPFSFATLPPGANSTLITNPIVTLSLSVKGTRQSGGGTNGDVASAATMKVNLASALLFSAQTYRNAGPFVNTGPMPPRAEQNTSYTVTWNVKNSANTVANAVAQALLPPYVTFVKGDTDITYDTVTRTVKWTLGDIKPGVGYTLGARQASFQVMVTPSTSQVGQTPQITAAATISGLDRFAQVQVDASADPVTIHANDVSGMDSVAPKQ